MLGDSFPGGNAKVGVMQRKSIIHRLAAFVILISFGITDAAVVFVSIWYNHTTNEKALWLEFDVAFIKFPKVLEFIVYDCQLRTLSTAGQLCQRG